MQDLDTFRHLWVILRKNLNKHDVPTHTITRQCNAVKLCSIMASLVTLKMYQFKPLKVQEFEAPRISRQSAHERGTVVSPTHRPPLPPSPQGRSPVLISFRSWLDPSGPERPEGSSQWEKNRMILLGIKPAPSGSSAVPQPTAPPRRHILEATPEYDPKSQNTSKSWIMLTKQNPLPLFSSDGLSERCWTCNSQTVWKCFRAFEVSWK